MTRMSTAIELLAADPLERPLLEHAEQLDLDAGGEVADFVEEDRAARRPLRIGPPCRAWRR